MPKATRLIAILCLLTVGPRALLAGSWTLCLRSDGGVCGEVADRDCCGREAEAAPGHDQCEACTRVDALLALTASRAEAPELPAPAGEPVPGTGCGTTAGCQRQRDVPLPPQPAYPPPSSGLLRRPMRC